MDNNNAIIPSQSTSVTPGDFSRFEQYLSQLGLPIDNVIASPAERTRVMAALPDFIMSLPSEVRRDARYLSKFIAGSAIGLFDASLNFVWNEVIINLRQKIVLYGLDLFYDAAVGEKLRDQYSTEEHLSGIKDKTLLDTCRKLELINDLVYTKLSHILTMRNDIGSSHPNTYSINSFELLGWLQTCIQEVIQVRPSAAAMTVKAIVDNLRKETATIRQDVVDRFNGAIVELSTSMTANLLVTLFGLFTSEHTSKIVRENILLFVPVLWSHSNDNVKYDLGEKVDVYKLNLDSARTELAEKFFEVCDGYRYLSLSTRSIRISSLCDDLYNAHNGWDNFYHEVPVIREIMQYIKSSEDIPVERQDKLIETILICRTGNGVSYNSGVSPGGRRYYDEFFSLLNPKQIIKLLSLLEEQRIRNHITGSTRCSHFREILLKIKTPINSARVNEIIDYLIQNHTNIYNVVNTRQYKDLTKDVF